MVQNIAHIALVVRNYDDAIAFYCDTLGFDLIADEYQPEQDKRWVLVRPKGGTGTSLLLAQASTSKQDGFIGDQAGGRVFLFLETDDFARDYAAYSERGVKFIRAPAAQPYGTVAVFVDLYGNKWDLIQFTKPQ
ncbi:catechol 2,3-dioxygenase-like lactoylglutathione lyase family enzyme [Sulfitobacter undariae]|uniref:Catechol 2,3-dioxygenase-like lactoylglutathione lyase family enzyme n=1 Tax=Sulfitobacter undariae TaxID=1563671 RepID=A0A7W6E6R3_9RHOB|nr:VOC family protein [Sulfitobacter undariae]MBB3994466.1 catechol 2,3-dioxygenase-like lactoylglutathione lyase family enzyme [Sulfitobacter undariae]